MKFPRKRPQEDTRWWVWRLVADAGRTLLAVVRTILWLWRESGEGPGGQ
ncbi:hypothetical protein KGD82_16080 [Nocardiopsis eucommiae]|uniref:Uncharacterized protein n=1 Tax=Nocardiopsis eucommiae TaxID=2831970 RepID=A0A975L6H5_9ACTN|nr:hypothetical protein KGD82_16080 [Nocardiopsis eucommiae]